MRVIHPVSKSHASTLLVAVGASPQPVEKPSASASGSSQPPGSKLMVFEVKKADLEMLELCPGPGCQVGVTFLCCFFLPVYYKG